MKEFKYQVHIDELVNRGLDMPKLHQPDCIEAFRYVFSDDIQRNHKPVLILNPSRRLPDDLMFSGYALSCYDDEDKAVDRYRNLCKTRKKMPLILGDALSCGVLRNTDGMISAIDLQTRHFDLYEYADCDLNKSFTIKKLLS